MAVLVELLTVSRDAEIQFEFSCWPLALAGPAPPPAALSPAPGPRTQSVGSTGPGPSHLLSFGGTVSEVLGILPFTGGLGSSCYITALSFVTKTAASTLARGIGPQKQRAQRPRIAEKITL